MCGIAGFYCYGDQRPERAEVEKLWDAIKWRGKDAAGLAYVKQKNNESVYFKQPGELAKVKQLVSDDIWAGLVKSHVGILHTRAATQGHENVGENNHPIWAANWLLTHNGMISNDDELWKKLGNKIERPGEVDSSAINLVLGENPNESWEDRIGRLGLLLGSAAIAGWNYMNPYEVLVAKTTGSPLYLKIDKERQMFLWCSLRYDLEEKTGGRYLGMDLAGGKPVIEVPENTAILLTPTAVRRYGIPHTPFRVTKNPTMAGAYSKPGHGRVVGVGFSLDSKYEGIKDKPAPIFQALTFDSVVAVHTKHQEPDGKITTRPTPYGTWHFDKDSGWLFRAHRRIRNYWATSMPANFTLPAVGDWLAKANDTFWLEPVSYTTPSEVKHILYMCPWCGIFTTIGIWNTWQLKCDWCQIRSKLRTS